jgi:phosphate butyryltransferase
VICDFNRLIEEAKTRKGIVVGVPAPEDTSSIKTVIKARKEDIAHFVLAGNREKISALLKENGGNPGDFEIIACNTVDEAASVIVELANAGKVHVILKGFLPTAALMKPILDKETGLRMIPPRLLSDILVVENPADNYTGLLGMTDGGLNILPDLDQKKQMIENAVRVFHRLGYERPKVGIMTAVETVKESMPATVDARQLMRMNETGEIDGCDVYGPLALDIAVSPEAAKHKKIHHPVAGNVQVMLVPNIEAGNLLGKAFTYYLNIPVAHVVMGARIPILIPSRNENDVDKIHSVALGVIVAKNA